MLIFYARAPETVFIWVHMKTIMMHFAPGPAHENAGGVFIGTTHDRSAVEHKA